MDHPPLSIPQLALPRCGEMETDEAGFHFDGVDGHQDCFHEMGGRRPGARPCLKTALVREWFLEGCPERGMMLANVTVPLTIVPRVEELIWFPFLNWLLIASHNLATRCSVTRHRQSLEALTWPATILLVHSLAEIAGRYSASRDRENSGSGDEHRHAPKPKKRGVWFAASFSSKLVRRLNRVG